jgi:succinate-semialdehyde dehydrogenase/glutarate-semialdehyde dehydrogenase
MKAINPATGQLIRDYPEPSDAEVAQRLQAAEEAFAVWRRVPIGERSARLCHLAEVLRHEASSLAQLITEEMGRPIAAAEAEIEKCAVACDYYGDKATAMLAPCEVATDASKSYVRYDPLGPILAVMPWNFPFWQVFRFAAPAVVAGNVGMLKHASNVPAAALAIERVFLRAGFPQGVMTSLLVPSSRTAELIAHPAIRAVTLTGSDRAGMAVAAMAGRYFKKTVLELGGSDPFIVLADVDVAEVAARAVEARMINSGQSCIAAKRFIVEAPIAEPFVEAFTAAVARLRVGDPMDRSTDIGPMARDDLLGTLEDQVARSVQAGAKLRTGGRRLERQGYFFAPTVLDQVEPGMPAFDEEVFGPVAAVVRARDRSHAVELANRSRFGLGASLHTRDTALAEQLAGELEAGMVFVNGIVKSDPRLPFGGVKDSGYGRELAEVGLREFVNTKTVWIG